MHQQDSTERLRSIHVSMLLCATLLSTLVVFAVNRTSLGQQPPANNCDPAVTYSMKSRVNADVPCRNATCVVWSSKFGTSSENQVKCTLVANRPLSMDTVATKYSLSVTATAWARCGSPTTSCPPPTCTEAIAPCGTWTYYLDAPDSPDGQCNVSCGSSTTAGYCKAN